MMCMDAPSIAPSRSASTSCTSCETSTVLAADIFVIAIVSAGSPLTREYPSIGLASSSTLATSPMVDGSGGGGGSATGTSTGTPGIPSPGKASCPGIPSGCCAGSGCCAAASCSGVSGMGISAMSSAECRVDPTCTASVPSSSVTVPAAMSTPLCCSASVIACGVRLCAASSSSSGVMVTRSPRAPES